VATLRRWGVAAGCSIGLAIGFGPIFVYSFGLFQKPMIAEFGWTRAEFSLGFSLATLLTAMLNYFVGSLIDTHGARRVVFAGVLILPAVLVGFSVVNSYPGFLAVAVTMCLVGATTTYPAYLPLLPPWFKTRLGLAFSLAAAGVGYGAALASLITDIFIRNLGWRRAFVALAGVVLVVGLLNVLFLIRDKPRDGTPQPKSADTYGDAGLSFAAAARSSRFWRLTVAFSIIPLVGIGINFHLAAMLTDRGFTAQEAAGVIAVTGTSILIGRLATGALLDYASARLVGLVLFAGQGVAVVILASGMGGAAPYIAAALLGMATGGEGDLMPYVLSRQFGGSAYGRIYGTSFAFFNIGTLLGPLLMGIGFSATGSYSIVLVGLACLSCVAAVLVYFTAPGRPVRVTVEPPSGKQGGL
jgi:nitrate/nitrite transporter NarK